MRLNGYSKKINDIRTMDTEITGDLEDWFNAAIKGDVETAKSLIVKGINIDITDEMNRNALMVTSHYENKELTILLIQYDSDMCMTDSFGHLLMDPKHKEFWSDPDIQETIIMYQIDNAKMLHDRIGIIPELYEKYKDNIDMTLFLNNYHVIK